MAFRHRVITGLCALLAACGTTQAPTLPALTLASAVDVPRFMGTWYVLASIPTVFEKGAHDATETYRLDADGTIATTFSFRAGSSEGPERVFHSRGFVDPAQAAVWGQQYLWPIKADYRIAYVSPDHATTVIAREKRDYVWIMARSPVLPEAEYQRLAAFVGAQGYDVARLQRVPQSGR